MVVGVVGGVGGGHVLEAPCGAHVELPDVEALELKHKQHTS